MENEINFCEGNRVLCFELKHCFELLAASLIKCNTGGNTVAYLLLPFDYCTFPVRRLMLQRPEFTLTLSQTQIKNENTLSSDNTLIGMIDKF